jgi:hypothetical protein
LQRVAATGSTALTWERWRLAGMFRGEAFPHPPAAGTAALPGPAPPAIFVSGQANFRVQPRATVAQTSKSAGSRVSKPANAVIANTLPTWKSAIQQVWKPALRASVYDRLMAIPGCAPNFIRVNPCLSVVKLNP